MGKNGEKHGKKHANSTQKLFGLTAVSNLGPSYGANHSCAMSQDIPLHIHCCRIVSVIMLAHPSLDSFITAPYGPQISLSTALFKEKILGCTFSLYVTPFICVCVYVCDVVLFVPQPSGAGGSGSGPGSRCQRGGVQTSAAAETAGTRKA